jgi:hypothetical protein
MSTQRIESSPTEALSYNPVEAKYWDRAGLARELERVYDICQGVDFASTCVRPSLRCSTQ